MKKIIIIALFALFVVPVTAQNDPEEKVFKKPHLSLNAVVLTSLQNETEIETFINGLVFKAQLSNKTCRNFTGFETHYFKSSLKDASSIVYDKRFGGGLAISFSGKRSYTDMIFGFDRIERDGEVRKEPVTWDEKINLAYVSWTTNFQSSYKGGFVLSDGEFSLLYLYPLSGEKIIKVNGKETSRIEASNVKSLYLSGSLGFFPYRFDSDWAINPYFKLSYEHQSWNKADYYAPGIGFRLTRKRVEFVNVTFDNKFKSSGTSSGEPRIAASINALALFDL